MRPRTVVWRRAVETAVTLGFPTPLFGTRLGDEHDQAHLLSEHAEADSAPKGYAEDLELPEIPGSSAPGADLLGAHLPPDRLSPAHQALQHELQLLQCRLLHARREYNLAVR